MTNIKSFSTSILMGAQFLFVAFGALVLVPILTGMDPNIALFTAGLGTLVFQLITKSSIPIFLASSFAFIAPISISIQDFGLSATLGGLAAVGFVYLILAFMVKRKGPQIIERYLPPVVIGPVIMVIGLKLAPVAVAMFKSFDGTGATDIKAILLGLVSLTTTVLVVIKGKRLFALVPIVTGIAVGYIAAMIMGVVDYSVIHNSSWFSIPWITALEKGTFAIPTFNLNAILYLVPVAIAPAIEHVGDIMAISAVTGEDYIKKPGLHRTLAGDGLATTVASILGGPPNTTYSEVTGAVALLKVKNPVLMRYAALFAIILAFFAKLGAFLSTIPAPVMGGIMLLLFGMIAAIGMNMLIEKGVRITQSRNLVITSVILITGIGDLNIEFGSFQLGGIGLAGILGVMLNLILSNKNHK